MNKVYRIIWNEVLGAWIAVAENTRGRGKSSRAARSGPAPLVMTAVFGLAMLAAGAALAGTSIQIDQIGNGTATGTGGTAPATSGPLSIAIGGGSGANAQNASVAIGDESNATGQDSVAVGRRANATASHAVAVGSDGTASGTNSVAIGRASAGAGSSVAIGDGAVVPVNSGAVNNIAIGTGATTGLVFSAGNGGSQIAIGRAATTSVFGSIAIGDNARTGANHNSIAIGTDALASGNSALAFGRGTTASGDFALALGLESVASSKYSVALGFQSITQAAVGTVSADIAGTTYNFAGSAPTSTLSVGGGVVPATGAIVHRTITNVAAGRLNATSTDAVNGSQLFAANQEITAVDTRVDTLGAGTASHLGTGATYDAATGTLTGPTYTVNGTNYTCAFGSTASASSRRSIPAV